MHSQGFRKPEEVEDEKSLFEEWRQHEDARDNQVDLAVWVLDTDPVYESERRAKEDEHRADPEVDDRLLSCGKVLVRLRRQVVMDPIFWDLDQIELALDGKNDGCNDARELRQLKVEEGRVCYLCDDLQGGPQAGQYCNEKEASMYFEQHVKYFCVQENAAGLEFVARLKALVLVARETEGEFARVQLLVLRVVGHPPQHGSVCVQGICRD